MTRPLPSFLQKVPLVGIFRFVSREIALPSAAAAVRGGIRALEVTMNCAEPSTLIREMCDAVPGATIGAGTVMSVDDARTALHAGARFIVCPHVDEGIVRYCSEAGVPIFPGAMTPTEVWRAYVAGATMVKLFPASTLGPDYVRALRGPFPQVDLLVTGGIDAENVQSFLRAGARGAAVGGSLFPKEVARWSEIDRVQGEAERLVAACAAGLRL